MKAYDNLAPYYDRFMSFLDYEEEAEHIAAYIEAAKAKHVLDLGAGSGGHLLPLLRRNLSIDALDISRPMLDILQEKLRQEGLSEACSCVCGDMCQFHSETPYDLIYALGDTIHHLRSKDDLFDFLRCSHRNLTEHGTLIFTWRDPEYFHELAALESFYEQHGEDYLLWRVDYLEGEAEARIDYTAFLRGNDGRFDKKEECHCLQVYTEEDIYLAAKQTGFEIHEDLYEAFFATDTDEEEYKEIIVLKKN